MRIASSAALGAVYGALLSARSATAIELDVTDPASIKSAASTIAFDMMAMYTGNLTGQIPGLLPAPYYWWEAGAMFGALIDYWYYTGDPTYNDVVTQALLFQTGPDDDYMPPNQTNQLGNDDQSFWGLAAMSAAESKFPNPPSTSPQWLALAQGVFNSQVLRWDTTTCGGGLRWQIFTFNAGYTYKNAISNGCFFNLAARLGFYTQNQTYFDWAIRAWDWSAAIGLVADVPDGIFVYDGSDDTINCTQVNLEQWTYNVGVYLLGAAVMYNQTNGTTQDMWQQRIQGLLTGVGVFFDNGVMYEAACEPHGNCDSDQLSFKAYLARWMAASTKVAPFIEPMISQKLQTSAAAAARSCSGGTDNTTCGTRWYTGTWDGTSGFGQQMSALEVVQGLLIDQATGPLSNHTGGISVGNPSAGTGGDTIPGVPTGTITTASRAGAGVLTAVVLIGFLGGAWWMVV